MASRPLRRLPLLLLAGAALALAGCGSNDDQATGNGEMEAAEAAPRPVVSATVPLRRKDGDGDVISAIAAGEGAVWVARSGCVGTVSRVDPQSNELVATIPVGFLVDVAVGEGAVWALGLICPHGADKDTVFRIDPETNDVVETIPLKLRGGGTLITEHMAAGEDAVWVTVQSSPTSGEILRIDPRRNEIAARIPVQGAPSNIATEGGSLWVLSHPELTDEATGEGLGSSLIRIDPTTNEVVATVARERLAVPGGSLSPSLMAVGEGAIWVQGILRDIADTRVAFRVDAETNEVVRESFDAESFYPFAVVDDGVWFLGQRRVRGGRSGTIDRLNSETLEVDAVVEAGSGFDAAFEPESRSFWLAEQGFPRGEKQSVVRVDLP